MYQVNASFDIVTATKIEPNWFQRLLGHKDASVTVSKDGTVSFVAGSLMDVVTKMQYLVVDVDTIKTMTVTKL